MTESAPAAASQAAEPAAAAPAAGASTHVSQTQPTGYQPASPLAQPTGAEIKPIDAQNPALQQPTGEKVADPANPVVDPNKPADPGAAEFKLPDEYKDKPWAAKVKSQDDLYKQIDNLTTLVGKKNVVPNLKDASPEEREAFYAQLRGKDASEYPMPENKGVPIPADTQPAVAKLFMENGISPAQAEPFLKGYLELREKQIAEFYNPEVFKTTMETAFGKDWETTAGAVRKTISTMMNPEDQKALDSIPNNLLGVVYRTLGNTINSVNETLKKYGATETFAHLQAPNGKVAATDLNAHRQGLRDQLAALSMRPHTTVEQQGIIDQLNKTYENDPRLQQA